MQERNKVQDRDRDRNERFAAGPCGGPGVAITQGRARAEAGSTRVQVRDWFRFSKRTRSRTKAEGRIGSASGSVTAWVYENRQKDKPAPRSMSE